MERLDSHVGAKYGQNDVQDHTAHSFNTPLNLFPLKMEVKNKIMDSRRPSLRMKYHRHHPLDGFRTTY